MAKIAFILLCHKDPDAIIQQAEQLTAAGDYISIHFDARSPKAAFDQIKARLDGNPNVVLVKNRLKCGWGEWSLVQATLNTVKAAEEAFPRASHFYMVSGDCMATKSAEYARDFLDSDDVDYIESFDYFESDWIKTGFREERLIYRHFFNERTQKRLFYWSFWTQRRLGITRDVPKDLAVMIGSQWWCLRRQTIEAILEFTQKRRDVMRFFRTTWIPDETFFQTVVRHLIPNNQIKTRTLTFLMFTDYGMPVTFYNDHYDLLIAQDSLFARKISPEAKELKSRLGTLYASGQTEFKFLTGRGRIGRRFASRFWETESTLGRDRSLYVVACKKWHVAKRLTARIREVTDIATVDYIFNEEDTNIPDLGGIQSSLGKRTRHRRALMRMLFDYFQTKQLVICLDTASIDLMQDFFADRAKTQLLEIDCDFTDDYLAGHAQRVGLAGDGADAQTLAAILPTIRNDIAHESDRIAHANFASHKILRETASEDENAQALQAFLGITEAQARDIINVPHLFAD